MSLGAPTSLKKRWTARELLAIPADRRNAILEAAATQAETDYRTDPDLTATEAFGAGDLHGDSANTETR